MTKKIEGFLKKPFFRQNESPDQKVGGKSQILILISFGRSKRQKTEAEK